MADFTQAFQLMIAHEGGYGNDPDDPGGETYKGVARKIFSKWDGWTKVDILKRQTGFPANLDKDPELQQNISDFYRVTFWDKINGDQIANQEIANSIFDFGVNAGVGTSASLAQMVVGAKSDGVIGPNSISAINNFDPEHFLASFTVAKIARYVNIVKKRPTSRKYFYGWVIRALGENA
ncbi:phage protein [Aquipluma nitroreducens]|uniref:Phage protein n=1 Tax=Aquipluma nitroreducens TaxID=2010828 RepID=A0A5K7SDA4_9BACT|nr:glycosyl hydrolase 108 family protein [Aquipluma nitroreducens]BBE19459.1 phage protein [Aquipluma nitroreducens]